MTLRLLLLRHAKSSWEADEDDHARPLTPRGARAATLVGRHLARMGPLPDLVLCSTARRAADTLDLVAAQLPTAPPVLREAGLYLCGETALLARLRRLDGPADGGPATVLLVAHNPDLQNLSLHLAGGSLPEATRRIRTKLPTAALVGFELDVPSWRSLSAAYARLVAYTEPRELETA